GAGGRGAGGGCVSALRPTTSASLRARSCGSCCRPVDHAPYGTREHPGDGSCRSVRCRWRKAARSANPGSTDTQSGRIASTIGSIDIMRHPAILLLLLSSTLASPAAGQQRQLTAADYARAERFLAPNTAPLVTGLAGTPAWLEGRRFGNRTATQDGVAFVQVDAEQGTRAEAFDQSRLAAALAAVTGGRVPLDRVPFQWMELSKDGRSITFRIQGSTFVCDLQQYTCVGEQNGRGAPPSSSVSPDGRWAAFIRDHNLWVQELATGREIQLTTDGVEGFGYATDNAGWTHSDEPVLTWSPDSRSIATFQHDSRGVGNMVLASTNVGRPEKMEWAYPVPGDSVVFRIHRVIINGIGDGRPQVVRLQMEPDAHRSTVSDHVACSGNTVCDL